MALLSDLTREQNRTKAMAFIGVSFGITFAIAMVLGPIITHAFGLHALFWMIAVLALAGIVITAVVPSADTHLLNRESSIVRGSFRKVLNNSRLLKLNFGIMCLHILLMSSFVALPLAMEKPGWRPANTGSSTVTMLVSFAAVVPFIIYAEKYRRMKQVFMGCVAVLFCAEVLLWLSGAHLWGIIAGVQLFFMAFNVMEAILPSLISKSHRPATRAPRWVLHQPVYRRGDRRQPRRLAVRFAGAGTVFIAGAVLAALWFWSAAP